MTETKDLEGRVQFMIGQRKIIDGVIHISNETLELVNQVDDIISVYNFDIEWLKPVNITPGVYKVSPHAHLGTFVYNRNNNPVEYRLYEEIITKENK